MDYSPGSTVYAEFTTRVFATGVGTNADSLPTGTVNRNGTDDGAVTVTVTNIDTGRYKATFVIPTTYVIGDAIIMTIAATVSTIADKAVVWQGQVGIGVVRSSTAQGGGGSTITLDAGASATDNLYRDEIVYLASGTGKGQCAAIQSYVGSTKVATIFPAWVTQPDNTTVFVLLPGTQVDVGNWLNAAPNALISGRVDANAQATAASLSFNLTGNITGNLSGSVGSVTGAVGSVTGAVGSVTGNVGGNVVGTVASVVGNVGGNVTGSVGSVVGAVGSVTGNVGGNVTGSVGSVAGGVGGNVAGSVASVVGNIGGNLVGTIGGYAGGQDPFTLVMQTASTVEGYTAQQALRLFGSVLCGTASGGPGNTVFNSMGGEAARVTSIDDASGNRSSVVLTP